MRHEQGLQGERGARGDHGQDGCDGAAGEQGPRGPTGYAGPPPITRRLAIILAVVLTIGYMAVAWVGERDSCLRQDGVRESSRIISSTARHARTLDAQRADKAGDRAEAKEYRRLATKYQLAFERSVALECGGLFPEK